jgi:hypothetical protein
MKHILKVILFVTLVSCGNNDTRLKEKELELRERELELKEKELKQKSTQSGNNTTQPTSNSLVIKENTQPKESSADNQSKTKYLYVLIETLQPKVVTKAKSVREQENELINGVSFPAKKEVKFESFGLLSEIVEVKNYSEDDKFKAIDKFERTVRQKLSWNDYEVKNQLPTDEYFPDIYKSSISDRKCFVFDTYAAASKSANKQQ